MSLKFHLAAGAAALVLAGCTLPPAAPTRMAYPLTRPPNQVDDYHGVAVADPYRWLEDDNSSETKAWVAAENRVTFDYLARLPQLPALKERLKQLWNYERYGAPFKRGDLYFLTKNDGLQNQAVLYWRPSLDATPTVLRLKSAGSPESSVS